MSKPKDNKPSWRVKQLMDRFRREWPKERYKDLELIPFSDARHFNTTEHTMTKVLERLVDEGFAKRTDRGYKLA